MVFYQSTILAKCFRWVALLDEGLCMKSRVNVGFAGNRTPVAGILPFGAMYVELYFIFSVSPTIAMLTVYHKKQCSSCVRIDCLFQVIRGF